jgi:DNA modification methylase
MPPFNRADKALQDKVRPGIPVTGPYWTTTDGYTARLYLGDVLACLAAMPTRSVQSIVTSPPYYQLRDYQTGFWEGGDPACTHKRPSQTPNLHADRHGKIGRNNTNWDHRHEIGYKGTCPKCGARQIDHAIGSEPTPQEYIQKMVRVFRAIRRVLRDDGTVWLNLGSSYFAGGNFVSDSRLKHSSDNAGGGVVGSEDDTFVLRDDLTSNELQYVLTELASVFS